MKLINSHETTYKKGRKTFFIFVDEYMTFWNVCLRHRKDFIYINWRINKKEAKKIDDLFSFVFNDISNNPEL